MIAIVRVSPSWPPDALLSWFELSWVEPTLLPQSFFSFLLLSSYSRPFPYHSYFYLILYIRRRHDTTSRSPMPA